MESKKKKIIFILLFICSFSLFSKEVKIRVTVDRAFIKTAMSSFSKTVSMVRNGNDLVLLKEEGDWLQVKTKDGLKGWLNKSAVMVRKSFVNYQGEVKNEILLTAAAAKANIMTAGAFYKRIYLEYKKSSNQEGFVLLEQLEASQNQTDPVENYQEFRKDGKLGEHKK